MRDRPDGPTLADLAREASARDEDRDLVARALAIAEREAVAGTEPLDECRAALVKRYGEGDIEALLQRLADVAQGKAVATAPSVPSYPGECARLLPQCATNIGTLG